MMHEIRNPLEALNNLIYLGLEKADEPETVRQYLRLAQEQTAALGEKPRSESTGKRLSGRQFTWLRTCPMV